MALRKTDCIRFGKYASLFAFGIAIAPETLFCIAAFSIQRQLRFFRFALRFLLQFFVQFDLLRKCGLLAHTSAAFLKNCCIEKLFICLRLVLAKIMAFFTTFTQFSLTPISRNVIILMFIERTNFDEPSNKIAIFNRRNFYEKRL